MEKVPLLDYAEGLTRIVGVGHGGFIGLGDDKE